MTLEDSFFLTSLILFLKRVPTSARFQRSVTQKYYSLQPAKAKSILLFLLYCKQIQFQQLFYHILLGRAFLPSNLLYERGKTHNNTKEQVFFFSNHLSFPIYPVETLILAGICFDLLLPVVKT